MKRIHIMHNLMDDIADQPEERKICEPWTVWQMVALAVCIIPLAVLVMQVVPGN